VHQPLRLRFLVPFFHQIDQPVETAPQKRAERVLDLACGTGPNLEFLPGPRLVSILEEKRAERAARKSATLQWMPPFLAGWFGSKHSKAVEWVVPQSLPDVDVHVTMVDASMAMLRIAREKAAFVRSDYSTDSTDSTAERSVQFVHAEIEKLPFASESFDKVTSFDVFCSVTHPKMALCEAVRVLKRGGKMLMVEHGAKTCNGRDDTSCTRSPASLSSGEWWRINWYLALVTAAFLKPVLGISLVRDHVSLVHEFDGDVHIVDSGTVTDIGEGMYRWFLLQKHQ